jgi:lipopolysaccharide export system permease protein
MKNSFQLRADADSMKTEFTDKTEEVKEHSFRFFDYHLQDIVGIYKQRAIERDEKKREEEYKKGLSGNPGFSAEETELNNLANAKLIDDGDSSVDVNTTAIDKDQLIRKGKERYDSIRSLNANRERSRPAIAEAKRLSDIPESLGKNAKILEDKAASVDTVVKKPTYEENILVLDSLLSTEKSRKSAINKSLTNVRFVKNNMTMRTGQLEKLKSEINKFQLERFKKLSYAITILIMFFIGAPLGSIIKKGGLGIPVLISISFFILFYVISMICEKYTRTDIMDPFVAAWMANFILLPVGMFFMKQAKNDARLFDTDFYSIAFLKLKAYVFEMAHKFRKTKSLN